MISRTILMTSSKIARSAALVNQHNRNKSHARSGKSRELWKVARGLESRARSGKSREVWKVARGLESHARSGKSREVWEVARSLGSYAIPKNRAWHLSYTNNTTQPMKSRLKYKNKTQHKMLLLSYVVHRLGIVSRFRVFCAVCVTWCLLNELHNFSVFLW